MKPNALWPVLLSLVAFLALVGRIEWVAQHPVARYETVHVHNGGSSTEDPEAAADLSWQALPPSGPEHARARQLLRRGEFAEAVALYETLVQDPAAGAPLLAESAFALRRADRCADAAVLLARALQLAPSDGAIFLGDAVTRTCLGDDAGARASFDASLALRPNHTPTREIYARFLARVGEPDRAIDVLEPAVIAGSNEERAGALAARARLLMESGRTDEARRSVEDAVLRAPSLVGIWTSGARTLLVSPDPADHLRSLEMALQATRLAPDLWVPHSTAGRALEKLGRPAEAMEEFRRAASLDHDARYVRTRLVELGLDLDPAVARTAAEELLEQDPSQPDIQFLQGRACARTGDVECARASYTSVIAARAGQAPEAWYNLGRLERDAGRLEAARDAYVQAITVRPDYEAAWNNLGLVQYDLRQFADAEAAFLQAIALRDAYPAAWSNLGRVYAAQDRYAEAASAWERSLALEPGDRVVRLRLAAALRRTGRVQEAIAGYRALVADEPRYVSAWFNLGIALAADGQDDAAAEAYSSALEIDPNHQDSLENLGYLRARSGQAGAAIELLTGALDREPADLDLRLKLAELAADLGQLSRCASELRVAIAQAPADARLPALQARCSPVPLTDN